VALGLPVYHIFEEAVRAEADPAEWENQISMMEMVLDTAALAKSVADMRGQHGKSVL